MSGRDGDRRTNPLAGQMAAEFKATRWQMFCYGVIPLAIFWGIVSCAFGYVGAFPAAALPPVTLGAYIALMFAGGLGVILWASGSKTKWYVLTALIFSYYVIRNGIGIIPRLLLLVVICTVVSAIIFWFRERRNAQ